MHLVLSRWRVGQYQEILEHCKSHRIPPSMIELQTLSEDLKTIQTKFRKENMTLAIGLDKIMLYYSHPLTHCQISETDIILNIKIPLITLESQWEVYTVTPIFFRDKNQICIIHADHSYLAHEEVTDTQKIISGTALKDCNIEEGLCFIDYFEGSSDDSPLCAKGLFRKKFATELNTICNYKCEPRHGKTILQKTSDNEYIITNLQTNLSAFDFTTSKLSTLPVHSEISGANWRTL